MPFPAAGGILLLSEFSLPEILRPRASGHLRAFRAALSAAGLDEPSHPLFAESLPLVFAASDFAGGVCAKNPGLIVGLAASGELFSAYPDGAYAIKAREAVEGRADDASLMAALRLFRSREMLRIAWRDLAGWAEVNETLSELSALASGILAATQEHLSERLYGQFGRPLDSSGKVLDLVVLAMGKLGAGELNFSSDIDLVFAFPENGETEKGRENEAFFTHIAREIVRVLSLPTQDGFVYRVDLRLRPYGESGPIVMSFSALEAYYQEQGRDWERYALIRGRPVTGDPAAGERLLRLLSPFVYRKYLDYGAFESLRGMKRMIEAEVRKKGLANDVKLCAGGIREAEFVCQALQLLRGGVDPALRERSLARVLPLLTERGLLPKKIARDLLHAYEFLRRTENRLQEAADLQTHRLPDGDIGRAALSLTMGFPGWRDFLAALETVRATVRETFQEILSPRRDSAEKTELEMELSRVWKNPGRPDAALSLSRAGYPDPARVLSLMAEFSASPEIVRAGAAAKAILDDLVPALLHEARDAFSPADALARVLACMAAVGRRTTYLALLLENPHVLPHLVRLCDASPMVADLVREHPMLLDELTRPRDVYRPPEREELSRELERRLEGIRPDDLEERMDALRAFKQVNTFRVAAADVTGGIYIMHVSDHLTEIAEVILEKALDMAWEGLAARHGRPSLSLQDPSREGRGFCVVALGKLGGIELSYGSDLDLVFLHSALPGGATDGPKPIDNATFFARLGQKMVHILSSHTEMGTLYEADMRLRPSGGQGMLVSQIDAYEAYQTSEAWTFEHQALVRARPVAGDPALFDRFRKIRSEILRLVREPEALRHDVSSMRATMRRELAKQKSGRFDLKQGEGGIVDIEFLVQYIVLLKAREYRRLTTWTDNVRLLETIAAAKLLPGDTAQILNDAYLAYRTEAHRATLLGKSAVVQDDAFTGYRTRVSALWREIIGE